ncbi:MAG: cysteine synthase A [Clostridia bacterium]|nr:cysteine synthase A [Clostridia bacterium]
MAYLGIEELIGRTPLLSLGRYGRGLGAELLAKLESFNPGGSAKDRVALAMIEAAEKDGRLCPGGTVIEPTSGNTGIGLAAIGAAKGYRVIIVMPDTMSRERQLLMRAYGAEVLLTSGKDGMRGAIERAKELAREMDGAWIAGQFDNPENPYVHERTTGPEIWADAEGRVDIFVAGVGTGGTLSGAGAYLKAKNPALRVVAVEPADSPLLSGGKAGPHGLQGIGANFVPSNLDRALIDEILTVSTEEAYATARKLAHTEGILCGISSGAALFAAAKLAGREENRGKRIVVILPDTGERYLSAGVFE